MTDFGPTPVQANVEEFVVLRIIAQQPADLIATERGHAQGTNSVVHADDFNFARLDSACPVTLGSTLPRVVAVSGSRSCRQRLSKLAVHELPVRLATPEPVLRVGLVQPPQFRKVLQHPRLADANVGDETGNGTSREGAAGEAEAVDLVPRRPIEGDEAVRLDDVDLEPGAGGALALPAQEGGGAHARVVPDDLLPFMTVGIYADSIELTGQPGHVGGDVLLA